MLYVVTFRVIILAHLRPTFAPRSSRKIARFVLAKSSKLNSLLPDQIEFPKRYLRNLPTVRSTYRTFEISMMHGAAHTIRDEVKRLDKFQREIANRGE